MNTLKNVLFFGLLLAVLCGVYLSLNRSPEPTLPPGLDVESPTIDMGEPMKAPGGKWPAWPGIRRYPQFSSPAAA